MNQNSGQIGSSLLSIEANVLIAGLTAAGLGWILYATATETAMLGQKLGEHWTAAVYGIYGVAALLIVVLLGFVVEGLAGLVEEKAISRLPCYKETKSPKNSQKTIWKSEYAYADFSRRRLRILVARNTAVCFVIFTLLLAIIFASRSQGWKALGTLVAGLAFSALFVYLWIDARKGLKNAIEGVQ